MKKKLVLFACIALMLTDMNGQDDRTVRFGFAIQPSVSWLKPDIATQTGESNRIGFSYGIISDIRIAGSDNYAFSTGILVTSLGGTLLNTQYHDGVSTIVINEDGTTALNPSFAVATEKYKLQYIDVPLTLKLKTNEIGYMTYYGQFGMDLGFNIKARKDTEYNFPESADQEIKDQDILDETRFFRTALQIGLGAEYNISGTTSIVAGLVWNNGLNSVTNKKYISQDALGDPVIEENKLKEGGKIKTISNFLGLTLGVFF